MPGTFPSRCPWMPICGSITIAVAIVAVPARSTRCNALNGCIDHRERLSDLLVIGRYETKAYQFQEARVDHRALIERWTTITNVVADCCIRVTRFREANKVWMGSERPIHGNG